MKATYRAMQVKTPGNLALVERQTPAPNPGEVLIAVEARGICGADASDIDKADPALQPRVPGHEVVGRIVAIGANTPSIWKVGQRVGVGRLGGHCNECSECRRGRFHLCRNQPIVGSSCDGGYAEIMIARATGLVSIPDELSSEEAAPILCAGIATFNSLKKSGAEPGDTVAVLGIGGLGHMALQYARKMGFRVVAVGRGKDIATDTMKLGAHRYIDTNRENPADVINAMGGAKTILTTTGNPTAVATLMPALAPEGRVIVLGVGKDPLPVSTGYLVGAERGVIGSITGSPFENEKTLDFSVLTGVRPMIETMPLERAQDAVQKMRYGDAKFRIVLTIGDQTNAHQ
ncbi:alcohol dehydrogenase catalytic domain-containing protein [Sinorhizobium psoraleae]|uniref:Alcohol dehydrogenase catalytic domain-containing protein n=1 Tax=Sinorhizobium psoraleae TaxID=520838 RepID=A0ABT4KMW8_9HYPH|nr:alcohol dehydrogenase catalytic domain-containing protein [Sinorhizobium psoraleae]MCZ4093320.1 alcohol dehydrogenase catalytic domain-containing protein [Sinorhizobium psoraleae]